MIIEHRDSNLKYPRAIKDEKTRLVLDWLLEFRFSSFDILAARIGQTNNRAKRFLYHLLKDGVIHSFKNVHSKNYQYVLITAAGASYLEALGRKVSHAETRAANLGRYSQVIHDLSVQAVVLSRLSSYSEVIWGRNITFAERYKRPDIVLKAENTDAGFWTAIKFERRRKEKRNIFMSFLNDAEHFKSRLRFLPKAL